MGRLLTSSILLLSGLAFFIAGCSDSEPIKIGFLASTSGKISQLGQSARDGALLAIETANAKGGVKGRMLELESYDVAFDANKAREGVRFLRGKGAAAIIGPVASQIAVEIVPVANELKVPVISPTVTTPNLSGQKDYFFRVYPSLEKNAQSLANYMVGQKGLLRFAVVWDSANGAFTSPWKDAFVSTAEKQGGTVLSVVEFNSRENQLSRNEILQKLPLQEIDGLLLLANPMDTALFCQQLHKAGQSLVVMGSDWSYAGTLTEFGGKTVEGFVFTTGLNMLSTEPVFLGFKKAYVGRFDAEPNFPAVLAYEATMYLIAAMAGIEKLDALPGRLVNMESFAGLQGTITLDEFGDARRDVFINEIRSGRFSNLTRVQ